VRFIEVPDDTRMRLERSLRQVRQQNA